MIMGSDRELVCKIAFETSQIASSTNHHVAWEDADESTKAAQFERLDRMLYNLDQSVFGRIARAVSHALVEGGVIMDLPTLDETKLAPIDARETKPSDAEKLAEAGTSPDDLITAGTPEEGKESFPGEARVAQPNHHQESPEGGVMPELQIAMRGEIRNPEPPAEPAEPEDDEHEQEPVEIATDVREP